MSENWNMFKPVLGNGKNFKFWHEKWAPFGVLIDKHPLAYSATLDKQAVVNDYWEVEPGQWKINDSEAYRYGMRTWEDNERLLPELSASRPTPEEQDTYRWKGIFTPAVAYEKLIISSRSTECDGIGRKLWNLKIPLKVQLFCACIEETT
jgi:hypothetical protein